jgi:hypothetical protein
VTSAERLAAIYAELVHRGVPSLVMGGHAVRYYGVDRNTVDYDFHVALNAHEWIGLLDRLRDSPLFTDIREAASWRPEDFRRFVVGRLVDGREELLECWRRNHLLAPFPELVSRREEGIYGGRPVAFLGLLDLIHSKETEREDDWRDVALLEEIADHRALSVASDQQGVTAALAGLRSRRGLEMAAQRGLTSDAGAVTSALQRAANPVTVALLSPFRPGVESAAALASAPDAVREVLSGPMRGLAPLSGRHLALVEVVRRLYKREAMAADRADKEARGR